MPQPQTDRQRLINDLHQMTETDLRSFIFVNYSPAHQAAGNHGKQTIVVEFVGWAESLLGPKLPKVRSDLDKFILSKSKTQPTPEPIPIKPVSNLKHEFEKAWVKDDLNECFQIFEEFVNSLQGTDRDNGRKVLQSNKSANAGHLQNLRIGILDESEYRKEKSKIYNNLNSFLLEH